MLSPLNPHRLAKVSFLIAVGSFSVAAFGLRDYDTEWMVKYGLWLSLLWTTVVAVAIMRLRRRGIWFLVGAPLALYWPVRLLLTLRRSPIS
jgi:hypothetical protein